MASGQISMPGFGKVPLNSAFNAVNPQRNFLQKTWDKFSAFRARRKERSELQRQADRRDRMAGGPPSR